MTRLTCFARILRTALISSRSAGASGASAVSDRGQGVDESEDGFLIAFGERGDALEAFPEAAGIGIVVDALDTRGF